MRRRDPERGIPARRNEQPHRHRQDRSDPPVIAVGVRIIIVRSDDERRMVVGQALPFREPHSVVKPGDPARVSDLAGGDQQAGSTGLDTASDLDSASDHRPRIPRVPRRGGEHDLERRRGHLPHIQPIPAGQRTVPHRRVSHRFRRFTITPPGPRPSHMRADQEGA